MQTPTTRSDLLKTNANAGLAGAMGTSVALTSTLHWFETVILSEERNDRGLTRLNAHMVQHAVRSPSGRVTFDINSSESRSTETHKQSVYNGLFECFTYFGRSSRVAKLD